MREIFAILSSGALMGALMGAAPALAQHADPWTESRQRESIQVAVNRCAEAVQAKLGRNRYGDNGGRDGSGARVLGISSVRPQSGGRSLAVSGVATSGRYTSIADGISRPVDLTWRCTSDYYGMIQVLAISPMLPAYGGAGETSPGSYEGEDYSRYGYRRY